MIVVIVVVEVVYRVAELVLLLLMLLPQILQLLFLLLFKRILILRKLVFGRSILDRANTSAVHVGLLLVIGPRAAASLLERVEVLLAVLVLDGASLACVLVILTSRQNVHPLIIRLLLGISRR